MLGKGILNFVDSRKFCRQQGYAWDLAHVSTKMHNFEVESMICLQKKYGSDQKKNADFNFFWIGLFDTRKGRDVL